MSKITCEVCGTVFPDSASRCPICGWSPDGEAAQAEPEMGEFDVNAPKAEAPATPAAHQQGRRIFDFDEANGPKIATANTEEDDDTPYYGGEPGMEDAPRKTNTALVVILVVFIALVLLATGVLVVKFLLPGKKTDKPAATTVPTIVAETDSPAQTEEEETTEAPTVPCTSLYAQTVETLKAQGEMWRLNVKASPEDTTDVLTYSSEDEKVVTVSEEGNLTAVGNGSTNIVVTCGSQILKCPVTVAIEETEPTTEATEAETEPEATEETKTSSGEVTLKLKRTDMTFSRLGVYTTIQLDCDLKPEDVTWRTSNSAIANVNNGVVTAMGPGIAKITAKYGDQEVSCIVRCKF